MKRPVLIYATLAVLTFLLVGILLEPVSARDETYRHLSNFSATLELIERNYVDEVQTERLMTGAYRGLLEALDPESYFVASGALAQHARRMHAPPKPDIGADISKKNGYAYVVSVLPGSPAEGKIGRGDYIRGIDGRSTRDMTVFDVRSRLEGEAGTSVSLKVLHRSNFETETLDLPRVLTTAASTVAIDVPDGILGRRIQRLDATALDEIEAALRDATDLRGVILDLRGCSRGDLLNGARLADLFLDSGPVLRARGKAREADVRKQLAELKPTREPRDEGDEGYVYRVSASPDRTTWRGPLAVLVDHGTAGSAEVATAGLAAHDRVAIVGQRTFGRAALQTLISLEGGAAVQLTVAQLLGPDDTSLLGKGLEPDEPVEEGDDEGDDESADPVLDRALERLESDGAKKKAA